MPIEIAQAIIPGQLLKAEYERDSKTWHSHRVMRDLHLHAISAYAAIYARMIAAIRTWVEQHITHGPLEKAERPFSVGDFVLVSPAQMKEIKKIIGDYHEAFIAGMIDPRLLHHGELARLIDLGILPEDLAYVLQPKPGELPPTAQRMITTAYQYGKAQAAAPMGEQEKQHALSLQTFAWTGRDLPLTQAEREALSFNEEHAAEYVRGLSQRMQADLTSTITDTVSSLTHEDVTDAVDRSLRQRTAWRTIISELGDASGDWSRDLGRIAATEKQRAMQEGQAREMVKRHGDPETISVAKIPSPTACDHCVRLHLTAGQGSPPRIFKLAELIGNGSNVGKKARDWLATVQPVHPWCACALVRVPEGWGFDEFGNLVPESLTRSELLDRNLRKAQTWYEKPASMSASVPEDGVAIRVADPATREIVDAVVAATPAAVFRRGRGVTLITTDTDRETTPLKSNDLAYWSGNEIRLMQTLPLKKVRRVLEHEIGHSLNVWLWEKFDRDIDRVHAWHRELWELSRAEGYVSNYARREPIENAAECSRLYLYARPFLRANFPRTFGFVHRSYADALRD